MKEILKHWHEANRSIGNPDKVLWLVDFDGTLAPIAKHPDDVRLEPKIRMLLRKLSQRFPGHVGILSGRRLSQLRRKASISGLYFGGTHGFELEGPGLQWRMFPLTSERKRLFEKLLRTWRAKLLGIRGLWIEDKEWTFCVHYRQTRIGDRMQIQRYLNVLCNQAQSLGFKTIKGLKALEIFSDPRWDKGQAALCLKRRCHAKGVFYIGDDTTDESVFRVLEGIGIGVRIGRSALSSANYYLRRQADCRKLLERILTL